MATPINDFVKRYSDSGMVRFHMPGHKGEVFHGLERLDITEIKGADYLYDADGIIGDSERQTAKAFGSYKTFFSAEGSSQCIKSMLGIIKLCADSDKVKVLAPRNVHKAFIDGCILLDIDVKWIYPDKPSSGICCCDITPDQIEKALEQDKEINCCYITSPDYLGNISDIKQISRICHEKGVPLLVDNAHGAYMAFLKENTHPISLGADMCCDSAHKTLPCYTGGAFVHISKNAPKILAERAKNVMSMFGSTSPSYLILQSLDVCSDMISSGEFSRRLQRAAEKVDMCKDQLEKMGWILCGNEKMKLTVCAARCGYSGFDLGDKLRSMGIEPEYCDAQFVVLMAGVTSSDSDFAQLITAFEQIKICEALELDSAVITPMEKKMSMRKAAFQSYETVNSDKAVGRVCAMTVTACQPSVPVVVSGEIISDDAAKLLLQCNIQKVNVLPLK